jgi:drug/metabolite transporter (DMT)-like permease
VRGEPGRRERLQVVFTFLVIFGGVMFVVRPDPTRAQTIFRVSLVVVGLIGLAWVSRGSQRP